MLKSISLAWFRGAGEEATLELKGRSAIVYGPNGSGKSAFVDGLEYVLNGYSIDHLRHAECGTHQYNAVLNTHRPDNAVPSVTVTLSDDRKVECVFPSSGSPFLKGEAAATVSAWQRRATILRQHELARFIYGTALDKYDALLPLLGLDGLDATARNLHQLHAQVEQQGGWYQAHRTVEDADSKREAAFGNASNDEIVGALEGLHKHYCAASKTTDLAKRCDEIDAAVRKKLESIKQDVLRHQALRDIAENSVADQVTEARAAALAYAKMAEPLVDQRIAVLRAADKLMPGLPAAGRTDCPACGTSVPVKDFRAHVASEMTKLEKVLAAHARRLKSTSDLLDSTRLFLVRVNKTALAAWRAALPEKEQGSLKALLELDLVGAANGFEEEGLGAVETADELLRAYADAGSQKAPAETATLTDDLARAAAVSALLRAKPFRSKMKRVSALLGFVKALEAEVRAQIAVEAKAMVEEISEDVKSMWATMHPSEGIEVISLYVPDDNEKAIDISLNFHGVQQDSPRLTLSEGYRNALGLCIFLAMAKRGGAETRPLMLDDVVVSFDRNHRDLIVTVLEQHFGDRQVVLLTHDREWYTTLRQLLPESRWLRKTLRPYDNPRDGISWSGYRVPFDEAKAHAEMDPDSAQNRARKTMETELNLISARIGLSVPHRRGDDNDRRSPIELLERISSDCESKFRRRADDGTYSVKPDRKPLDEARRRLVTWGNAGSHNLEARKKEAVLLIRACEEAMATLRCADCTHFVSKVADFDAGVSQCQCGALRWKH